MKKIYTILILIFLSLFSFNSFAAKPKEQELTINTYEIYKTQNMHNFLVLNTRDATVVQCQWSNKGNGGCIMLNQTEEAKKNIDVGPKINGRFKLIATENMWSFLMLDTIYGTVFQVQFSVKEDNNYRFVDVL